MIFLVPGTRLAAAGLQATPCTLAWNQCTNSLITGYALYYGLSGSTVTNRLDVGLTNQVTLKNLSAASNYFFSVVSYNSGGESPRSTVMYYTPPAVSLLKLTLQANNTMTLRFQVATSAVCHIEYTLNFQPQQWQVLGSAVADANGNVTFTDVLTNSPPSRYYRASVP